MRRAWTVKRQIESIAWLHWKSFWKTAWFRRAHKVHLRDYDPAWDGERNCPKPIGAARAEQVVAESAVLLAETQELLYASDSWSVLIILQAMDAAGKDSTIKHVMSGVNPQGCEVHSFKQPSAEELEHDFLWRCSKVLPGRGRIGIFNRSYYEDVLVTRVHPQLVEKHRLPDKSMAKSSGSIATRTSTISSIISPAMPRKSSRSS